MSSPRLSSKRANCCCSGSSRRLTTPRRSWPDLAIPVRQSRPVPRRRMQSSARPAAWSLTQSRQRQPTSAIHSMTRSRRQRPHGWPIHQLLRASALSPPKGSRRNPTLLPVYTDKPTESRRANRESVGKVVRDLSRSIAGWSERPRKPLGDNESDSGTSASNDEGDGNGQREGSGQGDRNDEGSN